MEANGLNQCYYGMSITVLPYWSTTTTRVIIILKLLQRAKTEAVELYGLPPHTTHVTHPLDVALFKPLKSNFSEIAVNLGECEERSHDWKGKQLAQNETDEEEKKKKKEERKEKTERMRKEAKRKREDADRKKRMTQENKEEKRLKQSR
uniref:DDE-1 domain-containing protein n=1 Tax=Magallana gigas TaxID=29159 RepID=K1QGR9_MAGGI